MDNHTVAHHTTGVSTCPALIGASGVASPESWWEPKNFGGGKMLDFRRMTLFCLEKHISMNKMTIFSKIWGAMALFSPLVTPMRGAKHFPSTSYFFNAWCVHSVHIFLLHKSNTDETQIPKQFTNNYCIWSPPCKALNNWGKMKICKKHQTFEEIE